MSSRPDAQTIKAGVSPRLFYQHELPGMPTPRKYGAWVDGGLCPFHDDTKPGSFRVNLTSGAFICFSCGTKGSDVISFVQQRYGLSFPDAVRKLAQEWGTS